METAPLNMLGQGWDHLNIKPAHQVHLGSVTYCCGHFKSDDALKFTMIGHHQKREMEQKVAEISKKWPIF